MPVEPRTYARGPDDPDSDTDTDVAFGLSEDLPFYLVRGDSHIAVFRRRCSGKQTINGIRYLTSFEFTSIVVPSSNRT